MNNKSCKIENEGVRSKSNESEEWESRVESLARVHNKVILVIFVDDDTNKSQKAYFLKSGKNSILNYNFESNAWLSQNVY